MLSLFRKLACAVVFLNCFSTFPTHAQSTPLIERSVTIDGAQRWFLTHVPTAARRGKPLVILLHGGTASMRKTMNWPAGKDWRALSNREGFALIAPNGTQKGGRNPAGNRQHWNDHRSPRSKGVEGVNDVKFILTVIDWAVKELGIDQNRVFVTGGSNGGMMTYRLLLEAPNAFAGAAAFIANLPAATPKIAARGRPVPLMIANATDDKLTAWNGGSEGARGFKDRVLSVPQTRKFWLSHNRARTRPKNLRTLPDKTPEDGCSIKIADHPASANGAKLRIVTMEGSGHTIPSRSGKVPQTRIERRLLGNRCYDVSGAEMAWAFMTGAPDPR